MSTELASESAATAASPVGGLPGEDMSWITADANINLDIAPDPAPLPAAADDTAAEQTPAVAAPEGDKKVVVEEPKPGEAVEAKPVEAKPEEKPVEAKPVDAPPVEVVDELTPAEKALIQTLPEGERPAAMEQAKKAHGFMGHYTGTRPIAEINQHLQERSPARYAELKNTIVSESLAKPDAFCRDLYTADQANGTDNYANLAREVVRGDSKTVVQILTGQARDAEEVKTALEFYDLNKDKIVDDSPADFTDEKWEEIEKYFPEDVPLLKEMAASEKQTRAELAALKSKETPESKAVDADKIKADEAEAQATIANEVSQLWDMGRDSIESHVRSVAMDPAKGAGIAVTAAEREAMPQVALLKDLKAQILFDGLTVEGKVILPGFEEGFTEFGKEKEPFKEAMLHMLKYTEAREKDNVLAGAQKTFPLSETYYQDRLKNPIFAVIDEAIAALIERGNVAPKTDAVNPGELPSAPGGGAKTAATTNANSDAWLVQEALARS